MQQRAITPFKSCLYLGMLILGYIGVYLCRKNLGAAIPLLKDDFNASNAQVGLIASASTIAYAIGKVFWGPVVDNLGGRKGFLGSLSVVCLFGAMTAFSPTLFALIVLYSMNRFGGSAGWCAMVKLVPDWFDKRHLATAIAWLSLSFVVGGACASMLAGVILHYSESWQAVMGLPAAVLLIIIVLCWIALPKELHETQEKDAPKRDKIQFKWSFITELFKSQRFVIVCGLSFALTLMRETFNFWTVDFLSAQVEPDKATFLSSLFDWLGIVGILLMGWVYDHLTHNQRRWTLFGILATLAAVLFVLPRMPDLGGVGMTAVLIGFVGVLVYGPYSLLAGVMAVEVRGQGRAATVAGLVDATGYVAAILSGVAFGKILDIGGYDLGFSALSLITLISAGLCLLLKPAYENNHSNAPTDNANQRAS